MASIDPIQIQRLVDGELELAEIQELLSLANTQPQLWQQMATAMIEDRLWQRSLRAASDDMLTSTSNFQLSEPGRVKSRKSSAAGYGMINWFLLAASLLVAGLIGYSLPQQDDAGTGPLANLERSESAPFDQDSTTPQDNGTSLLQNHTPEDDPTGLLTPAVYQPEYHLELPENSGLLNAADVGPVDPVPLYSIKNQKQMQQYQLERVRSVPREMLLRFEQAGYHVQQEIRFISGTVNDGQQFIVPVRTVRFLPRQ